MKYRFFCTLLAMSVFGLGNALGQESLQPPLEIPLHASGNFGELRGTHFHAGLDIKTQQRTGINVYSTQSGYVSRIKVSTWGYGKVIYIAHPNGQTTVYAHLDKFQGDIADYVLKNHYAKKAFEIEMFPAKGELPVEKGQLIALSGNTGGSGGPHLHYEVRDTRTQEVLNPFSTGLDEKLTDTKAPTVNSVRVYPLQDKAAVQGKSTAFDLGFKAKDANTIIVDTVFAKGPISFGIDTHDTADFNANKNGVYKLRAYAKDQLVFGYTFDRFSFSETNLVNALVDYPLYVNNSRRVQRLFHPKGYNLSVLIKGLGSGIVEVKPQDNFEYIIELCDYHGNEQKVIIPVVYKEQTIVLQDPVKKDLKPIHTQKAYTFSSDFATVNLRENSFFEDFDLDLSTKDGVLYFHTPQVYSKKNMTVVFDTSQMNIEDPSKAFIGLVGKNGSRSYYATTKKGSQYSIETKNFGQYQIMYDRVAPSIYGASFKPGDWLSNATKISFKVSDDLSGISSIQGYINDKWILLDYDYKTKTITHYFSDGIVGSSRQDVTIIVKDNVGNTKELNTHFFRK
ncbi:M23 family metallopeptidase [Myroides sp. LJL115]